MGDGTDIYDYEEIKEIRLEYPRNRAGKEDFSQAPWSVELLSNLLPDSANRPDNMKK
jgi:hypothetical protein